MGLPVFIFILSFLFITLLYEIFTYNRYMTLYKTKTLQYLTFEAKRILQGALNNEKINLLQDLATEIIKDPSVAEIWFTDAEFRLIYSTDPELLKSYRFQRLPAKFHPLYKEGFKSDTFKIIENKRIDKNYIYAVQAFKTTPQSLFDYTAGIKFRKLLFLINQEPLIKTRFFSFNPSITIAWILMLFIAFLISWAIGRYNTIFQQNVLNLLTNYSEKPEQMPTEPVNIELKPMVEILSKTAQNISERIKKLSEEYIQKDRIRRENDIRKGISENLFRNFKDNLIGISYAELCKEEGLASSFLAVRRISETESFFGIAFSEEKSLDAYSVSAGLICSAFEKIISGISARDSMILLNKEFTASSLSPSPVVTGKFSLTDNIFTITLAGFSGLIWHKQRSNNAIVFPSCGLPLGKANQEDFIISLKEEKIRVESKDSLIFFNDAFLSTTSVETIKERLSSSPDLNANELVELFKESITVNPGSFLFIIRKI